MITSSVDFQLMSLGPEYIHFHFPDPHTGKVKKPRNQYLKGQGRSDLGRKTVQHPLADQLNLKNFYYAVWNVEDQLVATSDRYDATIELPYGYDSGWHYVFNGENREMIMVHPSGYIGLIGVPAAEIYDLFRDYLFWLWGIGLGCVLTIWLIGFILIYYLLKPLDRIGYTATAIKEGNLKERINTSNTRKELHGVASTLNDTFDQLSRVIDNQLLFTANASHELRTPIAIILSELQWSLNKPRTNEEHVERIKTCLSTTRLMKNLVEELIGLAQLDTGETCLSRKHYEIQTVIGNSLTILKPKIDEKSIVVELLGSSPIVNVDHLHMQKVFINLFGNAIKYSPKGGQITVTVSTDRGRVDVHIRDRGPGIKMEEADRIFERFYQSDASRSEDGWGLGLAICRATVELHQGSIQLDSSSAEGSCFVVSLPVVMESAGN